MGNIRLWRLLVTNVLRGCCNLAMFLSGLYKLNIKYSTI